MPPIKRTALLATGVLIGASMLLAPAAFGNDNVDTMAPPDGYYDAAEGKTGEELKTALHDIIKGHDTFSYDDVWGSIEKTDADPEKSGNVILMYTGRSEPAGGNYNREHTWAKSHGDFGTRVGPGTDMHHLRPTDPTVNSTRNNLDFDNGGKEVADAPGNFYDSDSYEPRDEVKGDVARMIMYMAVRYEGDDEYVDLELNDEVENGKNPLHGKVSVLKEWSQQDPPSEFEKNRNDIIFDEYQHNRNPFIDNPDWVNDVWGDGDGGGGDEPTDPPEGCEEVAGAGDVAISDGEISKSDAAVSGCEGKAVAESKVTVDITHPDRGELSIYLYAPDGSYKILKDTGDSGADLKETYTVDLSDQTADGTWTLSVKDYETGNTGTLNGWSLALS